jgi:NADPH:quinone reductase-like Zn-dependent oxidoreductase
MNTMKAVRIHTYGGPEVLQYEDAPVPQAGEGEVLVRVHAGAVSPFDWKVRAGYLVNWMQHTLPLVLGWDVSGVIEQAGPSANGFKPGDAVFSLADPNRDGANAEYMVVNAAQLARKPEGLDHLDTASIPNSGLAAWHSLFTHGGLEKGQTVLIQGAAGGVGSFAVQLAKLHGATVIGTASENHHDYVRELGADEVVDYNAVRFEEVVKDADLVLDTVGGEVLERCWGVLKPGGMLCSVVDFPSAETAAQHGVRASFVSAQADPEILEQIAGLIESGQIQSIVSTVLPLSEIQQGHALSQSMHMQGKIVLKVAG